MEFFTKALRILASGYCFSSSTIFTERKFTICLNRNSKYHLHFQQATKILHRKDMKKNEFYTKGENVQCISTENESLNRLSQEYKWGK